MTKISKERSVAIVTECPYSGILRAIIEHTKLLHQMGFKIYFVFPATPRDRYGEHLKRNIALLEEYGEVLRSPLRRKYCDILGDKNDLGKRLDALSPDIVFSYTGYAGKLCRLLYREHKIRILYHVPQCIDIIRRPLWQQPIERWFEWFLKKYVTYYIACSYNEQKNLRDEFGVDTKKILTIPNYISGHRAKTRVTKKSTFIILGRVSRDKRVGTILEVAKQLGILDEFIVVGDGTKLARLKCIYPEVCFFGNIDNNLVHSLLSETKFIVSNSLIEGLPFSVIEAMNAGVVPILSDIPAHRDLVTNEQECLFFKNKSVLKRVLNRASTMGQKEYNLFRRNVIKKIRVQFEDSPKKFTHHFLTMYGT